MTDPLLTALEEASEILTDPAFCAKALGVLNPLNQKTLPQTGALTRRLHVLRTTFRMSKSADAAFKKIGKEMLKTHNVAPECLAEFERLLVQTEAEVAREDSAVVPVTKLPDVITHCCATPHCARKLSKKYRYSARRPYCDHHRDLVRNHAKVCSTIDCVYRAVAGGMCGIHLESLMSLKTSTGRRGLRQLTDDHVYRCMEATCAAQASEKGFCARHMPRGLCSAVTCSQSAVCDGLCNVHAKYPKLLRARKHCAPTCICECGNCL